MGKHNRRREVIQTMKPYYLLLLVLIIPAYAIEIDDIFKKGDVIDYKKPCFEDGAYCSGSTECNITILYPNISIFVDNGLMTNQYNFHNYTLPNSSLVGTYTSTITCIDGSLNGTETYYFKITDYGKDDSNIFGGVLGIIILIGILVVFGIFAIFYFENSLKFVFMLGTILVLVFGLNMTANIATEYGLSTAIIDLVWLAYKISLWCFWGMFLYVLVKLTTALKIRSNPPPMMKSPLQAMREKRKHGNNYPR